QNFRTTREGALSYFIAGDDDFPDDKGFAIQYKWVAAWYDNEIEGKKAIQTLGNIGIAMGNVYLRDEEVSIGGKATVVDKLFVYKKIGNEVRLIVHNSAVSNLPPSEPEG